MANSLTAMSPTYWSRVMGHKLYKNTLYRNLASFSEQSTLKDGQIVDRPYRADIYAETYTKGTALTAQDLTATTDTLTVNKFKGLLMYVDQVDKVQNKWDAAKIWAEEAALRLAVLTDSEFLYEVLNANLTVDDGDLGGTSGNPIVLTTTNIDDVFGQANRELDEQNVPEGERCMVISPYFYQVLWKRIAGKESILGDKVAEFGNVGRYAGFELYKSNNLTASVVWTPTDNPADEETLTINGVVFTFQSVIGTTAGNVLQTTNTETTLANLAHLINNNTTTADHVAFTGSNAAKVQSMVATSSATAITIYVKGANTLTVSDTADATFSKYTQHNFAMRKKMAVDMVVQQYPDVEMASTVSAGKRGMNILPLTIFGLKTFNQGKNEMVNITIDESVM